MNWKRSILLLAVACAGLSFSTAVRAATPAITDQEVPRYLTPQQATQWADAQKELTQANADLAKGQKLSTEQDDPSALVKGDIAGDHAKGAALIKSATPMKNEANKIITNLRKTALENRNKSQSAAKTMADLNFTVSTAQWPEAVVSMSKNVFTSLVDQKYKHVYLAGVYSFEKDGKYAAKPDLAAQVRGQLGALDKTKILAPKGEGDFKLGQENGKLFLSYPDRDANGKAKSAVVVGEVLFEPRSGYAAVSLRAVDLSNMRIVASQVMMLSVEPTFGKLLGLSLGQVSSMRIAPAATEKSNSKDKDADAEAPAPPVTVNLLDPNDFVSKAKALTTSFGTASAGHGDTLANRFAILMLKSYFVNTQKDLKTSDIDFLTLALPDEKPDVTATVPADLSGVWLVPNADDLSASIILDPIKARDMAAGAGADVAVGKLSIQRNLPKLTLPSTQDLKAGGY